MVIDGIYFEEVDTDSVRVSYHESASDAEILISHSAFLKYVGHLLRKKDVGRVYFFEEYDSTVAKIIHD